MKILEFSAPFGCMPELRLSVVPRWAIVKTTRPQSVAEHSFGVAVIAKRLCTYIGVSDTQMNVIVVSALEHDYMEVYTGDIPSPAKVRSKEPPVGTANSIITLADLLEAYLFIVNNCGEVDSVKEWVCKKLVDKIVPLSRDMGIYDQVMDMIIGIHI